MTKKINLNVNLMVCTSIMSRSQFKNIEININFNEITIHNYSGDQLLWGAQCTVPCGRCGLFHRIFLEFLQINNSHFASCIRISTLNILHPHSPLLHPYTLQLTSTIFWRNFENILWNTLYPHPTPNTLHPNSCTSHSCPL